MTEKKRNDQLNELKESLRINQKELKAIQKKYQGEIALLRAEHRKELTQVKRQVKVEVNRLSKKQKQLDEAIRDWNQKVADAEHFLQSAQESIVSQRFEKQEIMKKLARHLARETGEVNELLSQLYNSKVKTVKSNHLLLQKSG